MCSRYWSLRRRITSQNSTLRCAASTMYSIAGANMPSGKVDVNELAVDDDLGSGGIVSLPILLSPRCALPGEARRAVSTLAPIPLPHRLELNVGVWIGVPPVATISVMGFRLQERLRRGLARGRRENG